PSTTELAAQLRLRFSCLRAGLPGLCGARVSIQESRQTNRLHRGALKEETRLNTTAESSNSNSRVLIVDDNSRFARSAQLFLEHTGNYFACAVNDPRRALETARSFKPD